MDTEQIRKELLESTTERVRAIISMIDPSKLQSAHIHLDVTFGPDQKSNSAHLTEIIMPEGEQWNLLKGTP